MDLSLLPSLAHYSNILTTGTSGPQTPTPAPSVTSPTSGQMDSTFFFHSHTHPPPPPPPSSQCYSTYDETASGYHHQNYHHSYQHPYSEHHHQQKSSPIPFIHSSSNSSYNEDHCFESSAFNREAEPTQGNAEIGLLWNHPSDHHGSTGTENFDGRKYYPAILDYYHHQQQHSGNGYHHHQEIEEEEEDIEEVTEEENESNNKNHHRNHDGIKTKTTSTRGEEENYITITTTTTTTNGVVRVVKRRSANKKERRRTQSINSAFSNLRDCIPNVPADTKLSKIKTLRLATSYISYLMKLLDGPRENSTKLLNEGFRADLSNAKRSTQQNRIETQNEIQRQLRMQQYRNAAAAAAAAAASTSSSARNRSHHRNHHSKSSSSSSTATKSHPPQPFDLSVEKPSVPVPPPTLPPPLPPPISKENEMECSNSNGAESLVVDLDGYHQQPRPKCRTGWPQHVWALELKHYEHQQQQHPHHHPTG